MDGITCEQEVEPMQEMYKLQAQLKVLHAHYTELIKGITDPDMFGSELYSRKLIASMVLKDSKTVGIPHSQIISMLLEGVESMIGLDGPKCFANFVAFLKSHTNTTANIASSIEHMLGKQSA